MILRGRRIHIAGSTSPDSDPKKLAYAHSLVAQLVDMLANEGAAFIVPFGKEPFLNDRENGPSIIFDWTVAETIHKALKEGRTQPSGPNGRLIATVATTKLDQHIPGNRRVIFDDLRKANAIAMDFLASGWSGGAFRRQRYAQMGDIFIGISGGEGVEHAAVEYSSKGKPVIPLDLKLGSSMSDGAGGAGRLFERALAEPTQFFRVGKEHSAADLLHRIKTHDAEAPISDVVAATKDLLAALQAPRAFYVRLLNKKHSDFPSVEDFFRNTVDPVVKDLGYDPLEMGIGDNEYAWMNEAIFDSLHHSAAAVVDLTGLRPNCFMELGYGLGNKQRIIVTSRDDTEISFDAFALEAFRWNASDPTPDRIEGLRKYWARNINAPPLVRPREAK